MGRFCDYHTSGAWNALGCAAVTARRLGLDEKQTRQALGTAEISWATFADDALY